MPSGKSQIAFEELGLGSLLKRYRLRVPSNQREYAWTEREVTDLFQDFALAINDGKPYFLGTVVTIPREEGTLEVVDGQQRLATTAILLSAIRDYARLLEDEYIVKSIDTEFISGIDREQRKLLPRLTLNHDDNELFASIVTNSEETPDAAPAKRASHNRLVVARYEAGQQIQKAVSIYDRREHGDVLNRWVSFIEHQAMGILLKVPTDADAFKMFETLNDRGLRTSQADLIKNYLFARSENRIEEVQARWSYMRGALESATDDPEITMTFLRHALITQRGYLRKADVYEAVQALVKSEQAAVSLAATLENLSTAYVATFNLDHERWNGYPDAGRRAIEALNLLDIKPMRPLMLAITASMEPKEGAPALRFLISLGVRLMIASSTRTSSVELPLAVASKAVFDGEVATSADLQTRLASITPGDEEFREAFSTARVSTARLARYYLRSMEMAAKSEPEPYFVLHEDREIINLEHVLPRKPEDNWPSFTEEDVRRLATRLGNQALMRHGDNSEARSAAFLEKKPLYATSPYLLTEMLAEAEDWTEETINQRQKTLAGLAVSAWPTKF
jgi:uncharacterized protein with ParB-like and HNH nuclease domain